MDKKRKAEIWPALPIHFQFLNAPAPLTISVNDLGYKMRKGVNVGVSQRASTTPENRDGGKQIYRWVSVWSYSL